jgi:hypothetical protein
MVHDSNNILAVRRFDCMRTYVKHLRVDTVAQTNKVHVMSCAGEIMGRSWKIIAHG